MRLPIHPATAAHARLVAIVPNGSVATTAPAKSASAVISSAACRDLSGLTWMAAAWLTCRWHHGYSARAIGHSAR